MDYVPYPFNLLLMVLILQTSLWGDLLLNGALCALTARNEWVYSQPDTEKIPKRMMLGTLAALLAPVAIRFYPLNLALYGLLNLYLLYCGCKPKQPGQKDRPPLLAPRRVFSASDRSGALFPGRGMVKWNGFMPSFC